MSEEIVYSLVLPLKDEESTIPNLYNHLNSFLSELDGPAEVIIVDDGSTDKSLELLRELQSKDTRLTIVELSRNFGHQIAITAGLDLASGKATIVLDSDLQDPLQVIHTMIREWKAGYEIVYGIRKARKSESYFRRIIPWIFYRFMNHLANFAIPEDVGDFRLIDRKPLKVFQEMRERNRYVRGMFAWIGFRSKGILYIREGRSSGKSKYGWRKLVNLGINAIYSFSYFPVKASITAGALFSAFFLLISLLYPIFALTRDYSWNGRTQMFLLLLFLAGMNLLMLGLIGIYVIRTYDETRGRPLYVIRNVWKADQYHQNHPI